MGKKRIIKQSADEALKETAKIAAAQLKAREKITKKSLSCGQAYINATYNNTIITITDMQGKAIAWSSAGSLGFRGPKKATPYAASKIIEVLAEKVKKTGLREVEVYVRGIGSGRESAIRALEGNGILVKSIKDVTALPHNGPRPRKPRRV